MEKIIIYCDGGARGNPGKAAAAFVVEKNGKVIVSKAVYLGIKTNNIAEYSAVIYALKWLVENSDIRNQISDIRFVLDSELVVKQLNGLYKVKNEKLRGYYFSISELLKTIPRKIIFTNVDRSKNKLADFLVNKKLDSFL